MKHKVIFNIVVSLLIVLGLNLTAQNETKIWYFGANAGLDFNTSPPTVLSNGVMNTLEGCASIADTNGSLLFYTNGVTVWDKTNNVMANGSNLNGGVSSTQSSIILKKPSSSVLYYLFTIDAGGGGFNFSVIDMNLASGNGSITIKNFSLMASVSEKICAVKHSNGNDIWIIVHEYYTDKFFCYELNSSGLNMNPVVTSIGSLHYNYAGQMKVSPDGQKIGLNPSNGSFELFDFDATSGVISNSLSLGSALSFPYGCEFSSDSKKFYGTDFVAGNVYQWDLCAGTTTSILASQSVFSNTNSLYPSSMQLAANGKVYIANNNSQYLGVINFPNLKGNACMYSPTGLSISTGTNTYGLPSFMSTYFWPGKTLTIGSSGSNTICLNETRTLTVTGATTYTWSTGVNGSIAVISPSNSSSYSVSGTTSEGCVFTESVNVYVEQCLFAEPLNSQKGIVVYPNPAQNTLKLNLGSGDDVSIAGEAIKFSITNIYGEGVIIPAVSQESLPIEIDVSTLSNGFYNCLIYNGSQKFSKPFVVAK